MANYGRGLEAENERLRGMLRLLVTSWGYQSMPGETKHPMMQSAIDTAEECLAETVTKGNTDV